MFDGVDSPLTQSFGLGLFETIGPAEMQALENFFRNRGAEVFHEVSPIADPSLLTLLNQRGYQPVELTSVLIRPTAVVMDPIRPRDERIVVRGIDPGEEDLWARVAAEGWGESEELSAFVRDIGQVIARSKGSFCFLAELEGRPIAAAAARTATPRWAPRYRRLAGTPVSSLTTAGGGARLGPGVDQPFQRVQRRTDRRSWPWTARRRRRARPRREAPRPPYRAGQARPRFRGRPPRGSSSAPGRRPRAVSGRFRRAPASDAATRLGDSNATSVSGRLEGLFQLASACAAGSHEAPSLGRQGARDQRRQRCRRPRQHLDGEPGRDAGLDEHEPGSETSGMPASETSATTSPSASCRPAPSPARARCARGIRRAAADAVAFEQDAGPPGVLARHDIGVTQGREDPQRDVLEVPDRRRADDQAAPAVSRSSGASASNASAAAPTIKRRPRTPPARSRQVARGGSGRRATRPGAGPSKAPPAAIRPPPITTSSGL